MTRFFTTALLAASVTTAWAQGGSVDLPAPPDVATVPRDAARTSSGLASRVISPGAAPERPAVTDIVTVHYTGWSADGKMVDSSVVRGTPATFPLDKSLLGWRECVQLMTIGEKRRCWLPEALAYRGVAGRPRGPLVFDIELINTRPSPRIPPPDVKEPPSDALRTSTGLVYKVLRPGTGTRKPQAQDSVQVHYTGWTTDGNMFDSSITRGAAPATLALTEVIDGWTQGMQLMVEGERARFWIPQELAYKGAAGQPAGMLVFDIELVKIE